MDELLQTLQPTPAPPAVPAPPAAVATPTPAVTPAPTEPEPEAPAFADLNLPLVTKVSVFDNSGVPAMLVTTDGVLKSGQTIGWGTNQVWEWNDIASGVRSFSRLSRSNLTTALVMYVTSDNELWGFGINQDGILGDGTGVDRNEPVFILDKVVNVYLYGIVQRNTGAVIHSTSSTAYALRTDGSLWKWGRGIFEPVQILENVARFIGRHANYVVFHAKSGGVYRLHPNGDTSRIIKAPVYYFAAESVPVVASTTIFRGSNFAFIDSYNVLMNGNRTGGGISYESIAKNVQRVFIGLGDNVFFTTFDGILWGFGENRNGELGDSTRVPRPDPVQIAENVVYARSFAFLKQDGTYWVWNRNDPTPQQAVGGVIFKKGENLHLYDGRLVNRFGFSNESVFDNVKTPLALNFIYENGVVRMTVEELVQVVIATPVVVDDSYDYEEYEQYIIEDNKEMEADNAEDGNN